MSVKIFYGIKENKKDVTDICLSKLTYKNIINIPMGDMNRAEYFMDYLPNVYKKIFIIINGNEFEYDHLHEVKINITDFTITTSSTTDIDIKINNIHNNLKINYGSFNEELSEQKMVVRYLTGKEKVLEIGGNIGRNSLVIASIVNNDNFVTLESNPKHFNELEENRILNNFNFHIENSALSKRKLIQSGWETKPSDSLQENYLWVNTINFNDLKNKYNIEFDTLVLDCEGAFYYILMDMPEILNNINLIIMENDYLDHSHKLFIDSILTNHGFYTDYVESGGWGPCYNNFFEVWKK